MRLINCSSYVLEERFGADIPPYAILSHTWDREGEQTYQELKNIQWRYTLASCIPVLQIPSSGTLARLIG